MSTGDTQRKARTSADPLSRGWTVDGALDEIVTWIVAGSPLGVPVPLQLKLKEIYRPDVQDAYDKGENWPADRPKVEPLAHLVGTMSSTMTVSDSVINHGQIPTDVDEKHALCAAYLVSRGPCIASKAKPTGKYCDSLKIEDLKCLFGALGVGSALVQYVRGSWD